MTGGGDMAITYLRDPGEQVAAGDVVVKFDTTEQEYKLKEAEADLGGGRTAGDPDAGRQSGQGRGNALFTAAGQDGRAHRRTGGAPQSHPGGYRGARKYTGRWKPPRTTCANSSTTPPTGRPLRRRPSPFRKRPAIKPRCKARNRAAEHREHGVEGQGPGYVNVMQNTNCNFCMFGMLFPALAGGRHGKRRNGSRADSRFEELGSHRQHRRTGPRPSLGRAEGPGGHRGAARQILQRHDQGNRRHRGRLLESPFRLQDRARRSRAPGMRPGMSSNIVITTGTLPNSLWVPSQAVFESDSRTSSILQTSSGFTPRDVKLVRRSESQVVLTGLQEGQLVALANPELEQQSAQGKSQRHEGPIPMTGIGRIFSDAAQAFDNLRAQKTRTLLTALGHRLRRRLCHRHARYRRRSARRVAALHRAIGRAQRPRRIRVPPPARKNFSSAAAILPGSPTATSASCSANIDALGDAFSAGAHLHPARVLPKPSHEVPELYGVRPSYAVIHSLHVAEGHFFDEQDDNASRAVCVLGEGAKVSLLGYGAAVGKFVKVNDTWLASRRGPGRTACLQRTIVRRQNAGSQQYRLHPAEHFPVPLFRPQQFHEGRSRCHRDPPQARTRTASKSPRS